MNTDKILFRNANGLFILVSPEDIPKNINVAITPNEEPTQHKVIFNEEPLLYRVTPTKTESNDSEDNKSRIKVKTEPTYRPKFNWEEHALIGYNPGSFVWPSSRREVSDDVQKLNTPITVVANTSQPRDEVVPTLQQVRLTALSSFPVYYNDSVPSGRNEEPVTKDTIHYFNNDGSFYLVDRDTHNLKYKDSYSEKLPEITVSPGNFENLVSRDLQEVPTWGLPFDEYMRRYKYYYPDEEAPIRYSELKGPLRREEYFKDSQSDELHRELLDHYDRLRYQKQIELKNMENRYSMSSNRNLDFHLEMARLRKEIHDLSKLIEYNPTTDSTPLVDYNRWLTEQRYGGMRYLPPIPEEEPSRIVVTTYEPSNNYNEAIDANVPNYDDYSPLELLQEIRDALILKIPLYVRKNGRIINLTGYSM